MLIMLALVYFVKFVKIYVLLWRVIELHLIDITAIKTVVAILNYDNMKRRTRFFSRKIN